MSSAKRRRGRLLVRGSRCGPGPDEACWSAHRDCSWSRDQTRRRHCAGESTQLTGEVRVEEDVYLPLTLDGKNESRQLWFLPCPYWRNRSRSRRSSCPPRSGYRRFKRSALRARLCRSHKPRSQSDLASIVCFDIRPRLIEVRQLRGCLLDNVLLAFHQRRVSQFTW